MKRLLGLALGALLISGSAVHAQDYNRDRRPDQSADRPNDRAYDRRDDRRDARRDDHRDGRGDHREWGDREGFNREWGSRGADWNHQWRRGERLPDGYYRDRRYIVDDWRAHRLPPPRYGYHWIRYGDGYCMSRDSDGYIYRFIRDLIR